MPRLTNADYLSRHHALRLLYEHHRALFGVLSVPAQMDLHAYYQTSSAASDDELVTNRVRLNRQYPALTHQAGKAYARLDECFKFATTYAQGNDRLFHEAVGLLSDQQKVRAVVRPDVDISRLAKAILELAREQVREQRDDLAA